MRVLVAGTRTITPTFDELETAIALLPEWLTEFEPITVINGGAKGVDITSTAFAMDAGFQYVIYPADWKTHGRAAGPIRNKQMVDSGIDAAVIFWDQKSRGTGHMLRLLEEAQIPRVVVAS
jgi:hypothetical protein